MRRPVTGLDAPATSLASGWFGSGLSLGVGRGAYPHNSRQPMRWGLYHRRRRDALLFGIGEPPWGGTAGDGSTGRGDLTPKAAGVRHGEPLASFTTVDRSIVPGDPGSRESNRGARMRNRKGGMTSAAAACGSVGRPAAAATIV